MQLLTRLRDRDLVLKLADAIAKNARPARFMEVCGGHTLSVHKYGLPALLPPEVELISGPGCPVCVTEMSYIDHLLAIAALPDTLIASFGDLIRVPGSHGSLAGALAQGAHVRMVLSALDALDLARQNPDQQVVFAGIGFETTSPGTAVAIQEAERNHIANFSVLSAHKLMPPAMKALIDDKVQIDGYLAPGHVSTITGTGIYDFIAADYNIPVVVAGFEPADILLAILMLLKQLHGGKAAVESAYSRVVKPEGNPKALHILNNVFEPGPAHWRGLGLLPGSGLIIREKYRSFDAALRFPVALTPANEPEGCLCPKILKGLAKPYNCRYFAEKCTPESPLGACMVSPEGACHTYYLHYEHA